MPKSSKKQRPRKPLQSGQAWNEITDTVRILEARYSLTNRGLKRAAEAVNLLNNKQQTTKRQAYQVFLNELLHECGPHGVLLCAIALGQAKIVDMKKVDRHWLIQKFKANRNQAPINSSILQSLAVESLKDFIQDKDRRDQEGRSSVGLLQQEHTSDPDLSAPEQRIFENASLQGIAEVFAEQMCPTIRQVIVQGELKAAVTMVFPNWGLVDCLMSLDVGEWSVEWLAMTLFNAKAKRVNGVLRVVHGEVTLIMTNSEATLKGALDEAVDKVFLPELNATITASGVSMMIMKNGAIINLALGLDEALKIHQKLYAKNAIHSLHCFDAILPLPSHR